MRVEATALPEVLVVEPDVHGDERGLFLETFHAERYAAAGIGGPFVQDNHSRSVRGTVRGLHFQQPNPQGKLLTVVAGAVFDVAVDVRRGSPSFARWVAVELTAENHRQLWVPPGFAHGFAVVSDVADLVYKCTAPYSPTEERAIRWDDPDVGIDWPVHDPIVSGRDASAPLLADAPVLPTF